MNLCCIWTSGFALRLVAVLVVCAVATTARAEFAFRDDDTVAFLGDSITAARGYTKIVEHYTLMRFPDRKVRFVNAGKGGDTASGCLERLERDVFAEGATVVTVALGVNDIGWGMKATEENKQRYLEGIRTIIERCHARKVRPIICSAAITAEPAEKAENGFLQKMTDEGLALARTLGAETVDLQRGMREVQRRIQAANAKESDPKKHVRLHAPDGVHLTDLGQLAMAFAMLKGLGAPQEVSTVVLDAEKGEVVSKEACEVAEMTKKDGGLHFVRTDRGLPLTLGAFSVLDFRWVPVSEEISRYVLAVKNLPAGDYQIRAEGRLLGKASADQLARGMNLSTMTPDPWQPGGPWDAQSLAVKELVDARDKLWMSGRLSGLHLQTHPQFADLARQHKALDDALVALQRALAKPRPFHFSITKTEAAASAETPAKGTN
jgi:lysophospholipase L1-like esterase